MITKDFSRVIIVDFNVSKDFSPLSSDMKMLTRMNTLAYAAPELLKDTSSYYTQKIDLWAAGIILVMLLIGYHPFIQENQSDSNLINKILNGEALIKSFIN